MSERKTRIVLSAILLFLMGLMGANIAIRIMNQRQNAPAEALREHSPFGSSEDVFTPEQFEAQEEAYRARFRGTTTPAR